MQPPHLKTIRIKRDEWKAKADAATDRATVRNFRRAEYAARAYLARVGAQDRAPGAAR